MDEESLIKSLHISARNGDKEITKTILQKLTKDGETNSQAGHGHQANWTTGLKFWKSSTTGTSEKAIVDPPDQLKRTPMHIAAMHDNVDIVELLKNNGADLNMKDIHGRTPLMAAILNKSLKTIDFFLKHYSQQFRKDKDENVQLEESEKKEENDKATENADDNDKKMEQNSNKEKEKKKDRNKFLNKFRGTKDVSNSKETKKMIENQKENEIEKMKDIDRMNIVHVAILSKDKEVIDRIVNFLESEPLVKNKLLAGKDFKSNTPLHLAAQVGLNGDWLVNLYKDREKDLKARNDIGMTAFHVAAISDNLELLEKMFGLQKHKDWFLKATDFDKNTSLHLAVMHKVQY